ncbi:UNVERIFIED_CONTAM: hypothetical protein GTU68_007367, partial [Idotea baltica]|nr:hypothetical protein [Idotea baltica]
MVKTGFTYTIANYLIANIISCDLDNFTERMTIGTAVPDADELSAVQHYFIKNRSIFEDYNVGQFEKDALQKLDTLFLKNPVQIMVGGSGLYVDAVLKGLDYFPKVDPEIREKLNHQLQKKGLEHLQQKLRELDKETYNTIAIDNPQRVIRALEICIGTNTPYSTFKNKPKTTRNFKSIKIGLTANREIIYNRIEKRVDIMMQNGLLEEAKNLHQHKLLNALQTVGYRELFSFFDGEFTQDFTISEIKKNTRRF